jgi:predicted dehydrogenase/nucleoside-diphosphate-sugar epimerase
MKTHQGAREDTPALLRVALIGCGAIAKSLHLPVLAGHERIQLAALVDRDVTRAGELARAYGIGVVIADAGALPAGGIDAAIVATPAFHHAPCTIDLLQRGIHVLVEKPMATSYADAEAMVRMAREKGLVLAVGFFRRLFPSIGLMKSMLDSGWLGAPRRFVVEGGGMYNWAAATLGNMKKSMAGGGVLIDFGSHMIDLLFALFDEPAEVLDYRDNACGGVESDCSIRLRVQHGGEPVEGTVELARTRQVGNRISVECERGSMEFDVLERHRIRVTPHGPDLIDPLSGAPRPYRLEAGWIGEDKDESWYETFRKQVDDWVEAIRVAQPPKLSGQSALVTSRVIEECYRRSGGIDEPWVSDGAVAGPSVFASMENPPRRVLLTGASGFIGCRVAELLRLREKCDVRAVVNNPGNASRLARLDVEMVQANLDADSDPSKLVEGCDAVIHCAIGTEYGDRRKLFSVTVGGTRRLAEAALKAGVQRFVHLSTISVYGDDAAMTGTLDEATPARPMRGSDYGESKLQAEQIVSKLAEQGLPAVIFRPARVFGAFARTFITRPIQAIAQQRFRWLGSPDVPCDMVYVDNVAEAILRGVAAPAAQVAGEVFAISDGLGTTWREFYRHFADALDLDLDAAPMITPTPSAGCRAWAGIFLWPWWWLRGIGQIMTSAEFKALGRRVLQTEGVGTLPRWALQRFPVLERAARRLVKADGSLPVYRRATSTIGDFVEMGSGGAVVSLEKARRLLGYEPVVSRQKAMELTLDWIKHARII